jgi:hypothetical protein
MLDVHRTPAGPLQLVADNAAVGRQLFPYSSFLAAGTACTITTPIKSLGLPHFLQ